MSGGHLLERRAERLLRAQQHKEVRTVNANTNVQNLVTDEQAWEVIPAAEVELVPGTGRAIYGRLQDGRELHVGRAASRGRLYDTPTPGALLILTVEKVEGRPLEKFTSANIVPEGTIERAQAMEAAKAERAAEAERLASTPHRFDRLAGLAWLRGAASRIDTLGAEPPSAANVIGAPAHVKSLRALVLPGKPPVPRSVAAYIERLAAEGVTLALTPDGELDAFGTGHLSTAQREFLEAAGRPLLVPYLAEGKAPRCIHCGKAEAVTVTEPAASPSCEACLFVKPKAKVA